MPRRSRETRDRTLRNFYDESSALARSGKVRPVRVAFPKPRRLIALRLEEDTLAGVKKLAAERGLNFSTLMRMWITERLRREGA